MKEQKSTLVVRVGYAMVFLSGNIIDFFDRGSSVDCSGSWWGNVDVSGPQEGLRPMQAVLHVDDSLTNCHMQAGLQGLQQNLHNVFATRVDGQLRLHFLQASLRFLRGIVGVVGHWVSRTVKLTQLKFILPT